MSATPYVSERTCTRPFRRRRRWQPVCPECGYSLRRLTGDRCPECGEVFPTPGRVYRRWACRRLLWERHHRGSFPFAYLKTIALIVSCPAQAARGLVIPDRWAAIHLLLFAVAGLFLGSEKYFAQWAFRGLEQSEPSNAADLPMALWATQSFVGWLVTGAMFPLLGLALGAAVPGRYPAAKLGIAKWSLYSFATLSLIVVALSLISSAGMGLLALGQSGIPGTGKWRQGVPNFLFPEVPAPLAGAVLYAIWWARGVSVNPYLRRRGLVVFVVNAAAYIVAWVALAWLLFDPKALRVLL